MRPELPLQEEFVRLALAVGLHLPLLTSDYLGPIEWLHEARAAAEPLDALLDRTRGLIRRAEAEGDAYVAVQCAAVVAQIELAAGARPGYAELVSRLLGAPLAPPGDDELEALRAEVVSLAGALAGSVEAWERRALVGEAKWDAALDAYSRGREYVFQRFPVPVVEDLTIRRTADPITSLHLTWAEPDVMLFEVNVGLPRTAATTAYEAAHNIYPGDYLHMLVLTQHTHAAEGHVAASLKLKNAPENVIAEGIEETAYLRLVGEPDPDQLLAAKLEWLRRGVNLRAAIDLRDGGLSGSQAMRDLQAGGFMDAGRAEQELARIQHPLWGTYQYSYWLGRRLVEEADRRAAGRDGREAAYLRFLYGGLHVPETFLDELDALLEASPTS